MKQRASHEQVPEHACVGEERQPDINVTIVPSQIEQWQINTSGVWS